MVNFTNPPTQAVVPSVRFNQTVNSQRIVVVGGRVGSESLLLCRGQLIAFLVVPADLEPFFIASFQFIPVNRSPYMFAST